MLDLSDSFEWVDGQVDSTPEVSPGKPWKALRKTMGLEEFCHFLFGARQILRGKLLNFQGVYVCTDSLNLWSSDTVG